MRRRLEALLPRMRWISFDSDPLQVAVKTAAAAMICEAFLIPLGLASEHWPIITAVLVIQSNLGSSLRWALIRLLGTAAGALLGALAVTALGAHFWSLGIGLFGTLLLCAVVTPLRPISRMAAVTAVFFYFVDEGRNAPWLFSMARFMEIAFGLVVGLLVDAFLWPRHASKAAREAVAKTLETCATLYTVVVKQHLHGPSSESSPSDLFEQARSELRDAHRLLSEGRLEPGAAQVYESLAQTREATAYVLRTLHLMHRSVRRLPPALRDEHLIPALTDLAQATARSLRATAEAIRGERPIPIAPELVVALAAANDGLKEARRRGSYKQFRLEELLHLRAVFYAMRTIAEDLVNGLRIEDESPLAGDESIVGLPTVVVPGTSRRST
ncbi:multidrug efflux system protein MdtO [Planctomycetes bacterium Pan216]|uniref:Multidrug efflux system protein MdtO n=1 Tax=Kolteria novifilia TaxID=2527975 RepID=A0A518B135_9BACT|nr:multidrug efflux system protein MdtO [Planctomycetes bacterium Pan216]